MTTKRPMIKVHSSDRYAVLRRISFWNHDRIRRARILVAGAGALGNEVLKNLALLGIGHIVIVDFDRVELPNLSRSILFRETNEGESKAETAAAALRLINPDIEVQIIKGDIGWEVGLGVFRRMDVVIGGLDNRFARIALNQHCWRTGKPWIDGALAEAAGAVRIFVPPGSACYECMLSSADYREMNLRFSCQGVAVQGVIDGKIPTTPTMASIIAAMQVQEALKLLHGEPVLAGHEVLYDSHLHSMQTAQLKRREECLGHSTLGSVIEVLEFSAGKTTAAQLLARAQSDLGEHARLQLDREIALGLRCPAGHPIPEIFVPRFKLRDRDLACPACGEECALTTTHVIDDRSPHLENTLAEWGLPPGHVVRAIAGRQSLYYELTGDIDTILPWTRSSRN
ncbi:MAG TPA: ThiF family adenylyltransferase [Candidatus Angelobacter sp.]|nr:ThiF family adenylyltransferase [Candidatus Angelobacter sp.]